MAEEPTPTRDECLDQAGEVLGAIYADPDRVERLRRDLAARDAARAEAEKGAQART